MGEKARRRSGAEASSVTSPMGISTFMSMAPVKLTFLRKLPSPSLPLQSRRLRFFKPLHCAPIEQVQDEILCESCNGKGWLLCDFCEGQKTNVKSKRNLYHRCPSCKAVGYLLCSKCKVFKCVTFPDYFDGEE